MGRTTCRAEVVDAETPAVCSEITEVGDWSFLTAAQYTLPAVLMFTAMETLLLVVDSSVVFNMSGYKMRSEYWKNTFEPEAMREEQSE